MDRDKLVEIQFQRYYASPEHRDYLARLSMQRAIREEFDAGKLPENVIPLPFVREEPPELAA